MKILFLTNNEISDNLINWLKNEGEEVIVFQNKLTLEHLNLSNPEIIVSYNYNYIIKEDVINLFPDRIINLHISFLPWNRGSSPNIWSFLKNTPKGVTIHLIDKGIDTGNILLQKEILMDENIETLASSYKRLHEEIQKLFIENWQKIKNAQIDSLPQNQLIGSTNFIKDLKQIEDLFAYDWDIPILKLKEEYNKRFNS